MRRATYSASNITSINPISIHALHEESDADVGSGLDSQRAISIHALHEESDRRAAMLRVDARNFNPRSP